MPANLVAATTNPLHRWLEETPGEVIAISTRYADGYRVEDHSHSRSQLLHPMSGVVLVATSAGRWIVPRGHAMWIPGGVRHAVEMIGDVEMQSVYVATGGEARLPATLRVVGVTDLMRSLIPEAVALTPEPKSEAIAGKVGTGFSSGIAPGQEAGVVPRFEERRSGSSNRAALVLSLLVSEIGHLKEEPLALPFPADAKLAAMCRTFVERPNAHATIDAWARKAGMSRRSFTRHFAAETGLAFSTWRRQALLFAALPRLTAGEPVTNVALDLGYDSVPAFTTMFRRFLGAAPRAWLERSKAAA